MNWLKRLLSADRAKQDKTIYIAETAYALLERLYERDRQIGETLDEPMLRRFVASDWAIREDTNALVQSGMGKYGLYKITPNGRRVFKACERVSDRDPRAVGLK